MEVHLTAEQILLRDSAAEFIAAAMSTVTRARGGIRSSAPGRLLQIGELGWFGMLVPSSADGPGLGLTEMALVLEQAGRGLVREPIGQAIIAVAALAQGYAPHPILRRAMLGDALVVPALQESAHDPLALRTEATGQRVPRLTGTKMAVCADDADGFLVSARGSDGPALYYVARDSAGVSVATAPTVDGRRLATLELQGAAADLVPARQSSRGAVEARALITRRLKPLAVDGRVVPEERLVQMKVGVHKPGQEQTAVCVHDLRGQACPDSCRKRSSVVVGTASPPACETRRRPAPALGLPNRMTPSRFHDPPMRMPGTEQMV